VRSLDAGCRLLRQLHGLSQVDLAAMLGVNLKVIKALESGNGNPGLASIEKIAEAFGLAVVFVKKDTVAEIFDGEARAREKARSREADVEVLAAGKLSEQQLNAKNALKIGRARHDDGLHVEEGIYTGAPMPDEFLNLRVPQMMRLLARKIEKYEALQERIKARRDN
jgi:transcriptional regulator with XRE-family HTH domain